MIRALRSEWFKLRTTRTLAAIGTAEIATIVLACFVHLVGFDVSRLDDRRAQLNVLFDVGVTVGLVFALLAGSIAMTNEYRYSTIRSTLLKEPNRLRVLNAKTATQLIIGPVLAVAGVTTAVVAAAVILPAREIELAITRSDVTQLVFGTGLGGLTFALIGLALGVLLRSQVSVVVGALLLMLMIEGLLRAGVPDVAKYSPGSLIRRVAGETGPASMTSAVAAMVIVSVMTLGGSLGSRHLFATRDVS